MPRYFLERRTAWGDVLWAVLQDDRVICRCTLREDALLILDALAPANVIRSAVAP
jgi:hypothetical protein